MKNSMRNLLATGLISAGALASTQALALESVSYNYVGLQYLTQDLDDYNCDQDGLGVYGSHDLQDGFFVQGSLSDVSGDHCGSTTLAAGLGYHTLFGADSSIYGALSFERTDVDAGSDDSGLILAVGVRGYVTREVEARAEIAHHTIFDGDTQLNLGANYWFNQQFSATADLSLGGDATGIAIGLRMNY